MKLAACVTVNTSQLMYFKCMYHRDKWVRYGNWYCDTERCFIHFLITLKKKDASCKGYSIDLFKATVKKKEKKN